MKRKFRHIRLRWWLPALMAVGLVMFPLTGCKKKYVGLRVLNTPAMGDIGSMDPVTTDSVYDSNASGMVVEPLLQYNYFKRPLTLEPLLVKGMPAVSADKKTYTFELKKGILFHDNKCFKGGKGRELVAKDVFYSFRRMANTHLRPTPTGWWIFDGRIVGFDAYRKAQNEAVTKSKGKTKFDYDAPVEGFVLFKDDKYKFQVKLTKPFPQFLYLLAFQKTGIVPRECVEYYAKAGRGGFRQNPVGTGPYRLKRWIRKVRLVFEANKKYDHAKYPTTGFSEADKKQGHHQDAGKKLPLNDIVVMNIFQGQPQPAWIKFWKKQLDYSTVAAEYYEKVFDKQGNLQPRMKKNNISTVSVPLLDFIYTGFNFKDKLIGGNSEKARYLRLAMAYAVDYDEINRRFYNNECKIYRGAIPPGLDGHGGPRFKKDLKKAREYLKKAGYPDGKGLPELVISTSSASQVKDREDVIKRQMAKIGIKVRYDLSTFSQLSSKLRKGNTQMFSLAWGSDYPDAENNLMLFYGPNKSPGPNNWNYENPEYDKLLDVARYLFPSKQRTEMYQKLNNILINDAVFMGSLARTRRYIWHPHLKNFKPNETIGVYWKYLRVPKRTKK